MRCFLKYIVIALIVMPAFLNHPAFMCTSLFTSKVVGTKGVDLSNAYRLVPSATFYIYRKKSCATDRIPDFIKMRAISPYELNLK